VAVDAGARAVALMLGTEGIPRDANERGVLLAEFLYRASQAGLAEKNIYVDPIVLPISSQQQQLIACTEFMTMLPELAPGVGSTCGVSNVSNGLPLELRPILNRRLRRASQSRASRRPCMRPQRSLRAMPRCR